MKNFLEINTRWSEKRILSYKHRDTDWYFKISFYILKNKQGAIVYIKQWMDIFFAMELLKFCVIMFNYKRCLYLSICRSLLALGSVVNINHDGCRKTYIFPP